MIILYRLIIVLLVAGSIMMETSKNNTIKYLKHEISIRDSINKINGERIDSIINNTYDVATIVRAKFGKSKYKEE